jgi:hypothetical protein
MQERDCIPDSDAIFFELIFRALANEGLQSTGALIKVFRKLAMSPLK